MPPGFDPKSGSVKPKQPELFAFLHGREPGVFLVVDPKCKWDTITTPTARWTNEAHAGIARSSSCVTKPYSAFDIPAQP